MSERTQQAREDELSEAAFARAIGDLSLAVARSDERIALAATAELLKHNTACAARLVLADQLADAAFAVDEHDTADTLLTYEGILAMRELHFALVRYREGD